MEVGGAAHLNFNCSEKVFWYFRLFQLFRLLFHPPENCLAIWGAIWHIFTDSAENKNNHRCHRYRILYLGNCIFAISVF